MSNKQGDVESDGRMGDESRQVREQSAGAGARLRLMIVEDDQGTRDAVAGWIEDTPGFELLGKFEDARVALERIAKLAPDVALVDVNMPAMSGIEFVTEAAQRSPRTHFLMLTVYGDTDHIFQALSAGASGYLLKSTLRDELIAAIHDVRKGGSPMTSDVARKVVQSFRRPVPQESSESTLSEREKAVLDRLAMGYLYKEIAAELGVTVATVSTFVRRIYTKLQVRSRAQAVAKTKIRK